MKLLLAVLCCVLCSCTMLNKKKRDSINKQQGPTADQLAKEQKLQQEFNQALALMDLGKYNQAGRMFKKLLKRYPNTEMELLILYNLGGALEGLKKCDLAVKRYRQVSQRSLGRFKKIESKALLRMSYGYECLGDDAKVVATLLDLEKRSNFLSAEITKAEIPARLAAAYSRLGNSHLAESYFLNAQEGLKKLNSDFRSPSRKKGLLAKTLYYMGNMQKHSLDTMSTNAYVESQKYLQNYLLMSVEMDDSKWSPLSQKELLSAYEKIYSKVQKEEPNTTDEVDVRKAKTRQLKLLQGAISNIKNLQLQRFADRSESRIVTQTFDKVGEKQQKFELEMARVSRGNQLTREALQREALTLPGRIYSAPQTLPEKKEQ